MWRVVVGLAFVSACWASPRPPSPPSRDVDISLTVEQVELANGLKLVVVPEPGASEVSVTMRFAVGSVDDPPGREGLAHLVEHLMFEHERDGEALFDFLERSALGFSGSTSLDATVFHEHGPPAMLPQLLAVELARLQQACDAIPASSFARQREIVRNELRERESDDHVHHALLAGVFAPGHPLARTHATPQSIAAITREEACAFAAAHYTADKAVLVLSGAIALREARPLVEQAFGAFARGKAVGTGVGANPSGARRATMDVPIDRPWFVLAWPLPPGSAERARLRAVASMAVGFVNARVNGVVMLTELGAGTARQIAIAVAPSADVAFGDALDNAKSAIDGMGPWFASGLYEHAKNRAVHALAASLDHALERDVRFAEEVARGHRVQPSDDVRALGAMSRDDAWDLVRSALAPGRASVVKLEPSAKRAANAGGLGATFRELRRRRAEDPSEAQRPAANVAATDPYEVERARSRTLPNGLTVVLLPLATMPTVDIRLVLPVGTADEAPSQRGMALIAAHAIQPAFDAAMFRFMQSGGRVDQEVGFDHTELSVRGLAANIDILLSGLAATVREGAYATDDIRDAITWHQLTASTSRADRIATAAWRDALFGSDHPYRHAGMWAHANRGAFEPTALDQFRSQHYRPGGATLIIAGRFDPAVATRWVDHYFSDWSGTPAGRREREATLRPLAFAQRRDGAQLSLQIAFAPPTGDEAALQVVAEMLEGALADVREELAASYGLRASLVQRRLLTTIELRGSVDAARAGEAFALLRDRLARLRERSDETASLFVASRRRVLARLVSSDRTASAIASTISDEVARGRPPHVGRPVDRVRMLTVETIGPLFDKLALANAAILLRGPEHAARDAYGAIGREPSFLDEGR